MEDKLKYKVVLFGDSISRGVVFDENKGKYTLLKDNYSALLKDKLNIEIYNASRFGYTLVRGITKLTRDVIDNNPDIVLIEFGGNDCDFEWDKIADDPDKAYYPKTDFNTFEKTLKNLLEYLKDHSITPVLMSLPPIDCDRYLKWVSKFNKKSENNILKWLGSVSKIYWWQERYNSAILSIADETNTRCIDTRSAFLMQPDYKKYICVDGIHPNEEGHKIIARKIYSYITAKDSFLLK